MESESVEKYSLKGAPMHGYKSFKLMTLPVPKKGAVLGLVGRDKLGKSTAIQILAMKLRPNLGKFNDYLSWEDILNHSGKYPKLEAYFSEMSKNKLVARIKTQEIRRFREHLKVSVRSFLHGIDDVQLQQLGINNVLDDSIKDLSMSDLQLVLVAKVAMQDADVYVFDEPFSYLDIERRLKVANVIRSIVTSKWYVVVVDHDLALLDYVSDCTSCFYGTVGECGNVTTSKKEGIDAFLSGTFRKGNILMRDAGLTFQRLGGPPEETVLSDIGFNYLEMTLPVSRSHVHAGFIRKSEIIVVFGDRDLVKEFFKHLYESLGKRVSYKRSTLLMKRPGLVSSLLEGRIPDAMEDYCFKSEVLEPLGVDKLLKKNVEDLSEAQLQVVAICLCLGQQTCINIMEEPSSYLDCEQRIVIAKRLKKFVHDKKMSLFVMENDLSIAIYLADRVIVCERSSVGAPQCILDGVKLFFSQLGITGRQDQNSYLPRINKQNSEQHQVQENGRNFYIC